MDLGGRSRRLLRRASAGSRPSPLSPLEEVVKMPSHGAYVHWGFDAPVELLEWELTIGDDPGSSVGAYLALFSGSIDGSQCYLGLQTDVFSPGSGRGIGKGLIFSTWWSFDRSDTRVADDGFCQLGTHEGTFVGVRRPYAWTSGDYRVTLRRTEAEVVDGRVLDWFDLTISRLAPTRPGPQAERAAPEAWIGALRFPRRTNLVPATIEPRAVLFLEVYAGARTWADVDRWSFDVMAYGDGVRCPGGRTEYPRYPHGQEMPNVNVRYEPALDRVRVRMGTGVAREDPPARWP